MHALVLTLSDLASALVVSRAHLTTVQEPWCLNMFEMATKECCCRALSELSSSCSHINSILLNSTTIQQSCVDSSTSASTNMWSAQQQQLYFGQQPALQQSY
jgi:hypothetical protein